jgi:hypothetical protein
MEGTISSTGFASGDRFVVGHWLRSPVGPTVDVMWARPDGERVLLAPDVETADFVQSVYRFDRCGIVGLDALAGPTALALRTVGLGVSGLAEGELELHLRAGGPALRLPDRPLWFTRWVERPVARAVMDVRTWGVSPTGVHEWYQAAACRFAVSATATVDGRDLGAMAPLRPACGFGFSESPRRPSIVEVRPTLGVPPGWSVDPRPGAVAPASW